MAHASRFKVGQKVKLDDDVFGTVTRIIHNRHGTNYEVELEGEKAVFPSNELVAVTGGKYVEPDEEESEEDKE